MVTGAESVANDCQQKKSQIMARLYQNHISKCTINIKKKTAVVCLKLLQLELAQQY